MSSGKKRIVALISYENGRRMLWECDTIEAAVRCWIDEMTSPHNTRNPAMAVEWIVAEYGAKDGVRIGAFRRPDIEPRSAAWAQIVELAPHADAWKEA